MQPRERGKGSSGPANPISPNTNSSLVTKEISEITIAPESIPEGSRYKGFQPFTVQELNIIAKEITYKLED